jgi:hypothetical protein
MLMSNARSVGRISVVLPANDAGFGAAERNVLLKLFAGLEIGPRLFAYVGNDPVNATDPTGECRNRDSAGECVVTNRAGDAGAKATTDLQTEVRATDKQIQSYDDKQNVSVSFDGGKSYSSMSGKEVKETWATTTWAIDPAGTTYGNGNGGQITR